MLITEERDHEMKAREKAVLAGSNAYKNGKTSEENPYPKEHSLYKWWTSGWLCAQINDKK